VKQKPFSSTVAFVLLLALIAASPLVVPFFLCAGYVASGPILTFYLHLRNRRRLEQESQRTGPTEPRLQESNPKS
jgi:hypothetical protein